ncbi:Hypothetical protein NCS54_00934700 [Fusarium falciforme]|uniref:Hypothetical protein n=1 Tax=Fusarium falciforme TaxID=195108 RepID=UPI0023013BD2|nr:Hypothetical protein NCS54_00934700 [Fusarium falciforme]WAO91863.1 Hypothetical protein NCS54_00934700 [Fusarium falciforme]
MSSFAKLMSYKSVTDDDMDDCRSECSYYSLPELDETDPVRRIPASVVKQQAEAVPASCQMETSYPHTYNNSEHLPLRVAGPWLEYPLVKDGPYISGSPGPARVVVSAMGGTGFDVIYHPNRPIFWGPKKNTFVQARYHPKGSRRSNMPAQNQYFGQSPWGLASPSTPQPLALSEQSLALFNSQQLVGAKQFLDMQKWLNTQAFPHSPQNLAAQLLITAQQLISAQQVIASQQLIVAQQISATQRYLDTLQPLSRPSPHYSSQMMASAPLIPVGEV